MRLLQARSSNDDMVVNFLCFIAAEALTSHHRPVGSFCLVNLTASKGPDIPLKAVVPGDLETGQMSAAKARPEQVGKLGDIGRDPPRFIAGH
jgi:hypothetical protein